MPPATRSPNYYAASPLVAATLEPDKGDHRPAHVGRQSSGTCRLSVMSNRATASTQYDLPPYHLLYYPFIDMDAAGEEQAVVNSITLPRYTDGIGVQMMVVAQSPTVGGGRFTIQLHRKRVACDREHVVLRRAPSSGRLSR